MTAWLHRLVVHLPIGLLVTGVLVRAHARWRGRVLPDTRVMMAVGVAGAWLACLTGLVHAWVLLREGGLADPSLRALAIWHLGLSFGAAWVFSAVLWLTPRRAADAGARLCPYLEAFGTIMLLVTAHLGGLLAHG